MKIDIHTHTKKCKSGDAPTREISPAAFCETLLSTEVKIIAITNHNVFDLMQYKEIISILGNEAQVWPGIELDILEGEARGHLLVIVSPKNVDDFSAVVSSLTVESTPDSFTATIRNVLDAFDHFNPLYIAHYRKKPDISDEVLGILQSQTKNPECVIKEVANSISAGIYISHGHPSIYGSDVQDWSKYEEDSKELPELRLPVDSFEHFSLLLKKDPNTINTLLDRKTPEYLALSPFEDLTEINIKTFNDINVIFGPKGTGKSCILEAIAKHYHESGIMVSVYESGRDRFEEIYDSKGKNLTINLNTYDIKYCTDEIKAISNAVEVSITPLSKYALFFNDQNSNKRAKKILLKDIQPQEESSALRSFNEVKIATDKTKEFLKFITENTFVRSELIDEEITTITEILSQLLNRLEKRTWKAFSDWKEISLLNSAIKIFRNEIQRKTGMAAKPTTTGFRDYAKNRIAIELNSKMIIECVESNIPMDSLTIGSLGSNKGSLQLKTEYKFQNGYISDSSFQSITSAKKKVQKDYISCIRKILENTYTDSLFSHISKLNEIDDVEDIKTVLELLLFKRYFALDGQPYVPSSGESSMVMLEKELSEDKDVYILDEPERSLGNEYINDVIVPLINECARAGKKVFISTHDANIAVRTLPYSSIYRSHDSNGYKTYVGNPFTNNLINLENAEDQLDWKKISMRTLEGGEEAFGERGKIYGNT
jgi:predicted ATPase